MRYAQKLKGSIAGLHRFSNLKLLRKSWALVICLQLFCYVSFSQNVITGRVTGLNGEPLAGATVKMKGSNVGTNTDDNGRYSISAAGNGTLEFSFIGYVTQEARVDGKQVIDVILLLEDSDNSLKDVVVVGYGRQSREAVTTSITKLDNKVLENVPFSNLASAMQGTLSGVRVQSISGQPGSAPRVIVRGGTSINNPNGASPLYIIDGVIRPQINDVSPDDIESLQVLKDAASTAIYGARGSNGVVIITTKSGRAGVARVNYSYDLTFSEVGKKYDLLNARDYITAHRLAVFRAPKFGDASDRLRLPAGFGTGNDLTNNTAFTLQYLSPENEHKLNEGWQSMPDPADPTKTLIFDDNNFQDLTYQTGVSHNHHISVSGGTDKAKFHAGIGYLDNQGTVITTKYKRLSFDLNGELKVKDNLSFFGRVMYSNSQQNNSPATTAETFYRSAGLAPTAKLYFEDGTLAPGTNSGIGNPLYFMTNRLNQNSTDNLTLSVGSNWQILPGLSFDPQVSIFNVSTDAYSFTPGFWNGPLAFVDSRNANGSNYRWRQMQGDAVLTYNKNVSDHHFDVKAGFSYYGREESRLSASGRGASTDLIPTLNASGEAPAVSSSISDQTIVGYFSRLNYDYNQKYLFSMSARYDGASNLGENHKWGFFPGVSIGWNLHKEDFWMDMPEQISRLKLRASYGVNGNISGLSDFQSQGAYGVGARYGGAAAIQNTIIPNPDLKWEQSKTFDIGADFGLFNDRVTVLVDYFSRVTDNLITSLALPRSTGFTSILTNLGSLENKGIELELNANLLSPASDFQWNISFNASRIKNKILSLPPNGTKNNRVGGDLIWNPATKDYDWAGGLQEGGTLGDMYSLKQIGIYATDAAAASAPVYTYIVGADKTKFGGDTEWLDSDGNNVIDSRDQVYMGNIYPKWTGGVSNSFSYKNFNLYVRMDYTTGHTIFNYGRLFLEMNGYADGNLTQRKWDNMWREQGDIAQYSRFYWGGERVQRNNFMGVTDRGNSLYYESGNFLCVRELTLSYTIPSQILKKWKIQNLRFNVTGNNIHYFTKYSGLNPEEGGKDDGRYPMPKNIIFSANITL